MYEFLCEHTFWVLLTQTYLAVELLVQLLSHVRLFASPWTAAPQASLSIINTRSLLRLMSIESVMPSNHLLLYCPLLLLPSIFPTDPMDCSTPTFPVHHQLPELAQTHMHQVSDAIHQASDAIQPFHPLSSLFLVPSVFPSIRVFSKESVLRIR